LRIWPLFYATIAIAALIDLEPMRQTWPWHAAYLSNFFYGYLGSSDSFRHFWSLAVEEQFYLVWPAVLLLLPRTSIPRTALVLIAFAPLFRMIADGPVHRANYLPLACFDSLGIGAILAYFVRYPTEFAWWKKHPRWFWVTAWFFGITILLVLRGLGLEKPWITDLGHTLVVVFFAWVVHRCATGSTGIFARLLDWPLLIFLGQISYGLYVFHNLFTRLQLAPLFRGTGLPEAWADLLPVKIFFQASLTVLFAIASWYCLERPINRLKQFFELDGEKDGKLCQQPARLSPL
jgi:peptidoglycan/LPS O-acetylase OafA/YrhL